MKRRQLLAAIDVVLSALDRRGDIYPELVDAYVVVGEQSLATMTTRQFQNAVRIAVDSIDLDPPVTRRRMVAIAERKRKELAL